MVVVGNIFGSKVKGIPSDESSTEMSQDWRVKDTNRIDRNRSSSDTTISDVTQEQPEGRSRCPECGGPVIYTPDQAETVCEECGLVVDEESIDRGPEWRAFTPGEKHKRSRVGAPMTNLLHDKGLSTTIDWRDSDAHGTSITSRQRELMQRLRTWDERFRTKDAHERNLKQALGDRDTFAPCMQHAVCIILRGLQMSQRITSHSNRVSASI